uniref:ATP synthase F(0) complex subunit f, mitochondrial n=1 Tax=Peromyscus maniculatus bairdii TaxID=230844 RepID=A0A8C8T6T2_PERMB
MASLMPLEDEKLMEVKLGELPSWILMWNFTSSGIVGAFQRGSDRYHKYINVQKGSISGINMMLAAYMVFKLKLPRERKGTVGGGV